MSEDNNRIIECQIDGSFIKLQLIFTYDNGENWFYIDMIKNQTNNLSRAILPEITLGKDIIYYFEGTTISGEVVTENNNGFFYLKSIPPISIKSDNQESSILTYREEKEELESNNPALNDPVQMNLQPSQYKEINLINKPNPSLETYKQPINGNLMNTFSGFQTTSPNSPNNQTILPNSPNNQTILLNSSNNQIIPPNSLNNQTILPNSSNNQIILPNSSSNICRYCKQPLQEDYHPEYVLSIEKCWNKIYRKVSHFKRSVWDQVGFKKYVKRTYSCITPQHIPVLPPNMCKKCGLEFIEESKAILNKTRYYTHNREEILYCLMAFVLLVLPYFYYVYRPFLIEHNCVDDDQFYFSFIVPIFFAYAFFTCYRTPHAQELVETLQYATNLIINRYCQQLERWRNI